MRLIWNLAHPVLASILFAVIYGLVFLLSVRHMFYVEKMIVPLPRFLKLSSVGLLLATLCGIFGEYSVCTILIADFGAAPLVAETIGLLSGATLWFCCAAAFYYDLVETVYIHTWAENNECPLVPPPTLGAYNSAASTMSTVSTKSF